MSTCQVVPEKTALPLKILVVEDDVAHQEVIADVLEAQGHQVSGAATQGEAEDALQRGAVDLVVTDLKLPGGDGLQIVARCRALREGRATPQCIVVTGYGTVDGAVEAMREGALHYLQKPLDVDILRETVRAAAERIAIERENRQLQTTLDKRFAIPGILGQTQAMQRIFDVMNQIADTDATVLITGDSGTGKELVAQALHRMGPRRGAAFVPLNCASLAEGVLESELFGHEEGAFTGAVRKREGRFAAADGGTLFLDEIGDMPLSTQAHLLRALESGEITPVGANTPEKVDVRVLAATHRDLEAMVAEGTFREDLAYRLRVVQIHLPPLRERLADLAPLAEHFLAEAAARHGKPARRLSPEALDVLLAYGWPGNVRELRNALESMVLMTRGEVIEAEAIPGYVRPTGEHPDILRALSAVPFKDVERALIANTLRDLGGNRERASQVLGISTRTLYRKIKAYGLSRRPDPAEAARSDDGTAPE